MSMNDKKAQERGFTSTLSQRKLSKADPLIEALGSMDEACAVLGMVISEDREFQLKETLNVCQRHLSQIMAELSGYKDIKKGKFSNNSIKWLDIKIEDLKSKVPIPNRFIMSFEKPISAKLNLARSVIRRAERRVVAVFQTSGLTNPRVLDYLNKLSTLLYLLQVKTELA